MGAHPFLPFTSDRFGSQTVPRAAPADMAGAFACMGAVDMWICGGYLDLSIRNY